MQEGSFRELVDNAGYGISICRVIMDGDRPVDVAVEYTNEAGLRNMGEYLEIDSSILPGHTVGDFIKEDHDGWLERCHDIGYLDKPMHWNWKNSDTQQWITIYGTPLKEPGLFSLTFLDSTRTQEERIQNYQELNLSSVILQCAQIFQSDDMTFAEATRSAFNEMAVLLHPDRIYLGQINGSSIDVIVDWEADGIADDLSAFQHMDHSMIRWWDRYLDESGTMMVDDVSRLDEKTDAVGIRALGSRNVQRFIVTMLREHGETIGYLGVDNYRPNKYIDTRNLVEAVAFFAGAEMHNRILQERLTRLSRFDELTGLLNRNAYNDDVGTLARAKDPAGFIFCDLNGLKQMNDEHGHNAGDNLLRRCANALTATFGDMTVYRVGGDEFMVVAPGFAFDRFEKAFALGMRTLKGHDDISMSVGHAWAPTGDDIGTARQRADAAMYAEKAAYYLSHDRRRR